MLDGDEKGREPEPEREPRIEMAGIASCKAHVEPNGSITLWLYAQYLPSLPMVHFGMTLVPGTTPEDAEALAAEITKRCELLVTNEYDIGDGFGIIHYPPDEHGRPKVDYPPDVYRPRKP